LPGVYLGEPQGGGGRIVNYTGDRHVVLVGPNGTGKGTRLLVQNLLYGSDRSMLVIDPKGELAALTINYRRRKGDVVVLNPFGQLTAELPSLGLESTGFNPLARLDPESPTFPDDATGLAEALIRIEGTDPHWPGSAQELVAALIMHVRRSIGPEGSLGDVRRLLTAATVRNADGQPVRGFGLTAALMAASKYEPLAAKAGRFATGSREIDSIVSTASTQTRFLDSPALAADLKKGGFDFADLKRRVMTVYLILPADRLRTHSGWLRLMVESALRALYTPPGVGEAQGGRVLFILDEFAQLGYLPAIEDAAGIARGYGVQLFLILQDLNQAHTLYRDRWQSLIASAGATMGFAPRDMFTADYLAKLGGQRTEWIKSASMSISTGPPTPTNPYGEPTRTENFSLAPVGVPFLRPEDLMALRPGQAVLYLEGQARPLLVHAPSYWDMADMRPHVGRNPYHR
jgi:type IV secretion system protein VirD4